MKNRTRPRGSESGIALIFALLAIMVLGLLAATVLFTSRSQTWTAINYRMTTQSRYAAEAGIQRTMNWLSSSSYTAPTSFASYTMTTNPVQYNGNPVVLSAVSGVSSNYPDTSVSSAFNTALENQSIPGVPNATYSTYATLLRMTPSGGVSWLGSSGSGGGVMQTWQITSVASINGIRNASVQVVETFERTGTPIFNYPIEATGTGCNSIYLDGATTTDSFNSSAGPYSSTNSSKSGGNIATNGNVTLGPSGGGGFGFGGGGAATVNGTVYVPNTSVGACPDGITVNGSSTYTSASALTSSLNPPLPWGCSATPCNPPGTLVTTAQNVSTSCTSISGCTKGGLGVNGTGSGTTASIDDGGHTTTANVFTLAPGSYGNITIDNADVVHVSAGTYNINSINFAQDGQFVVDSGPVVFNIVGNCSSGCPSEFGLPSGYSSTEVIYGAGYAGFNGCRGGVTANPNVYGSTTCGSGQTPYSGIPSNLQIVYGGSYTIRLGGMPNSAVIYAPKSNYYTPGSPVGLYGSAVIGNFDDASGSPFHYDSALQNAVVQVGQFRPIGGFSWSKF
jgi:Tfp pilus assembly protein PilX